MEIILLIIAFTGLIVFAIRVRQKPFYDYTEDYEKYSIPLIRMSIGSDMYNFLIDTGASFTLISDDVVEKHKEDFVITGMDACITGIDGNDVNSKYVYTEASIDDTILQLPGIIYSGEKLRSMYEEVCLHGLLGYDFLERNGIKIDTENKKLVI